MKFKEYLNENNNKGETTVDGSPPHFHTYMIDNKGNGYTDKTVPPPSTDINYKQSGKVVKHSHKILEYYVSTSGIGDRNHLHKIK